MNKLRRTERGWAGHFICAHICQFRRNTLLEYGKVKIVVSTVGNMRKSEIADAEEIGCDRFYETMAFHSNPTDKLYHDADVSREVNFKSNWAIDKIKIESDNEANKMHEKIVAEISRKLMRGIIK